jgi:acetylornithine/N-succinyldiaminopimelate aminotransferase
VTAAATSSALLPAYARNDVTFVAGDGAWLTDADGKRYLDLLAGIAVVSLGHCHPAPRNAAHAQLDALWHTSNLYSTEPMLRLADLLSERFGGARAFFCNSGAEAVEAALKWARKATGKPVVVALENSFHGRTHGALAATGQPAKRAAFEPLAPAVRFAALNDAGSLAAAVGPDTGAILIEPVQGEGGIHAASPEFLAAARELADEHGALLVLDEVQCGVGRTGTFFAWEQLGVKPDALTLAKGLANGLPVGALLVADEAPQGLEPGDHGSTFGGNPVACAAGAAVVETIDDALLASVVESGAALAAGLSALAGVTEVRGRGLLLSRPRPARRPGGRRGARGRPRRRHRRRHRPAPDAAADDHGRRGRGRTLAARGGTHVNKFERQGAILRLVAERELSTQSDVVAALRDEGVEAVQATVSRDIAQLGLVKVRGESGRLVYAHPGAADLDRLGELTTALRRWAVGLEAAGSLLILRTPPGHANALALALDEAVLPEIAGCIAGDDTIFVAPREGTTAAELEQQLRHHLDGDT